MSINFHRALSWSAEFYSRIYLWAFPAADAADTRAFYGAILRRWPFAPFAHLAWGRASLEMNDLPAAYSSALATLELSASPARFRWEARSLLAECFIKSGQFVRAKEELRPLIESFPERLMLRENLAAAELGLENFSESRTILEAIGEARLSASGLEALKYLRRLERGDLYH